jgi:hypothetical protein
MSCGNRSELDALLAVLMAKALAVGLRDAP